MKIYPCGKKVKHAPRISKGYRYVYAPEASGAKKSGSYKGYIFEHRLVMENFLGRPLQDDEAIHHIDLDKLNNSIENLMVLSNSKHAKIHHLLQGHTISSQDCKDREKIRKVLSCEFRKCVDCGVDLSVRKDSKSKIIRCVNCAIKHRRKVERPNKETLTNQLTGSTMVAVAKIYGVSDNAIKKWAIQYGIDFKRLVNPVGFSAKANERSRTKEANEKRRKSLSEWHRVHDNSSCKPVVCLTQDGKVAKKYRRIADAKKDGFCDSMISRCCLGKCKTYKGLVWQYQNPTSPTQ